MTIWWILLICLVITVLAFYKMNPILSIVAGASWLGLLAYTRTTPFTTIALGSTVDTILIGIFGGMAITIWLNQLRVSLKRNNGEKSKYEQTADENGLRHGTRSSGYESPEAYAEKLKEVSRRRR